MFSIVEIISRVTFEMITMFFWSLGTKIFEKNINVKSCINDNINKQFFDENHTLSLILVNGQHSTVYVFVVPLF